MSTAHFCPQCGKPLPSDGPKGQCPACLLAAALAGQSDVYSAATVLPDCLSTTASAPEAGTRLKYFGDYELHEEIARGGMGVVWKARQTSLNRDVALKMIRAGVLAGPDEVERFLREAEAAANLQHPNIVAIHEVGEHGGQHYFSMDYVAGRDLGALVKDGPLSPRPAARYVKIIAEAIHFAHQRGTLHRDLKPQNVLIDAADQPRITDFGLAKFMNDDSRMTQSGVVMGTPSYMPPEQAAGRQGDIGPASDVYSLGAMLYELLTGRPPFRGSTPMATVHQVLEAEPAAPRRLKADIPPDLETICLKCLEKSPSARYPTARALAEELDRFLKGEPIQARPASAVRKTVSWARRHPGVLAALAALVMVSLAFGIFYLVEENAFLRAKQADPALARVPGPRHQAMEVWSWINMLAFFGGMYLMIVMQAWARGLSVRDMSDPARFDPFDPANAGPTQPLGERTRTFAIGAGLVLIGCGVMLLVTAIQAHVWEGESILDLGKISFIYGPIFFGLITLGLGIRDYRLVHYGPPSPPSRQLTAEQIEPIRCALEDRDLRAAIKRYREAALDADRKEEIQYVVRLWQSLRAQHPDKFGPPPLSLSTLNWKLMGIYAWIEAVILAVLWYAMPPTNPALTISTFASGFLFGMGLTAAFRVKGLRKQVLLLAPGLAVTMLSVLIVPHFADNSKGSSGWGIGFGMCLMFSAFNPLGTKIQ